MLQIAQIYIRHDVAYVPTMATSAGPWIAVEPILTTPRSTTAIVTALQHLSASGHPHCTAQLNRQFYRSFKSPLLAAVETKSWKALAQRCQMYQIYWSENTIELTFHTTDQQGGYLPRSNGRQSFRRNTSLESLVEMIMRDMVANE